MKNNIIYLSILMSLLSCQKSNNDIDKVLSDFTNGAVLRTITQSGEFNIYDTEGSVFEITLEEHDTENGDLLQDVQIFTKHQNGNEALMRTIQASDFTTGPKGLPRVDLKLSLKDALTTLGIGSSSVAGGDKITFRFQLNLTDGRSFTDIDSSSSLTGSYFAAPFSYSKIIKCIPLGAIDGLYTLNLVDSYGDGWNGAALVVTVDGEKERFTLGSNLSSGKFTKKIEGATTMSFVFESGEFDSEVSYSIVYQSLDGDNEQTAISDGPSPTPGEKILSICQ